MQKNATDKWSNYTKVAGAGILHAAYCIIQIARLNSQNREELGVPILHIWNATANDFRAPGNKSENYSENEAYINVTNYAQ